MGGTIIATSRAGDRQRYRGLLEETMGGLSRVWQATMSSPPEFFDPPSAPTPARSHLVSFAFIQQNPYAVPTAFRSS